MTTLFDPLKLGDLVLPNRIVMAPLTRTRAIERRVPNPLHVKYYEQRASAGLILSEATVVTAKGVGYANTPGIYSEEQVAGWRRVTRAVHAAGGRIFLQLWHCGRISHPRFLDGELPVAPSAIAAKGHVSLVRPETPYPVPRALELPEIEALLDTYQQGARNALDAGFDGVEVHAANGYLVDQFLQDKTNQRTDLYGGSIENRARFLLQIVDRLIKVWGPGRVGVHLAPRGDSQDMGDSNPLALFSHVAKELGKRGIAFIFVREHAGPGRIGPELKKAFGGNYIANEGFTLETAQDVLARGEADAVSFGRLFISNPDLPTRLLRKAPLNEWRAETFFSSGPEGYTDYPALAAEPRQSV